MAPPFYTDNTAPGGKPAVIVKKSPPVASTPQPAPKPADPYAPLTLDQLNAIARQRAQEAIDAEQRATTTQQNSYDAQQEQHRQAYVQLAQAASELMKGIGPGIQAGYRAGAGDLASIGAPLTEGVRADLQKSEDANRAFVESQVKGVDPSKAPDPAALKDVLYGTGVVFPSQELEARGLAGLTWGLQQPGLEIAQGTADLRVLDQQIEAKDAEYRQQLSDIAAKFPQLRDQAMADLQKWEIDKANYKIELRKQALQDRAQSDIEQRLGITQDYNNQTLSLRQQTIDLQRQGLRLRQQKQAADVQKRIKAGATIDASASRVAGHLIDKNGNDIVDASGQRIPVAAYASSKNPKQAADEKVSTVARAVVQQALQATANPTTRLLRKTRARRSSPAMATSRRSDR